MQTAGSLTDKEMGRNRQPNLQKIQMILDPVLLTISIRNISLFTDRFLFPCSQCLFEKSSAESLPHVGNTTLPTPETTYQLITHFWLPGTLVIKLIRFAQNADPEHVNAFEIGNGYIESRAYAYAANFVGSLRR